MGIARQGRRLRPSCGSRSRDLFHRWPRRNTYALALADEFAKETEMDRMSAAYRFTAVVLLNTLVIFAGLNIAIGAISSLRSLLRAQSPVTDKYVGSDLARVYPDKSTEAIRDLLAETWSRPYIFEPYTQFKERPHQGRYVNVSEDGFRLSADQAAWPPEPSAFTIFVFGGSTTFGYGVADTETVPSHLQAQLRKRFGPSIAVFNFGRGFYYSTQERILFEQLVARGHQPNVAVFVDGLNDFYHHEQDEPSFTSRLRTLVDAPHSAVFAIAAFELPLARAGSRIAQWLDAKPHAPAQRPIASEASMAYVIARYLANKRIIEGAARANGIYTLFVWQPAPTYKYDQSRHLFAHAGYGQHGLSAKGYHAMAILREKVALGDGLLWCADIQDGRIEPLYVDVVHYTAAFSADIATCILTELVARKPPALPSNRP